MIIRFPTALYKPLIPQEPQESGNVTFTISNETPPRTNLLFTELPPGVEQRQRPPRTIPPVKRRLAVENRTYTVLSANESALGSNRKIVEAGQVLEFDTSETLPVDPMLVAKRNEFQHNTNLLDLEALGISTEDQAAIVVSANSIMSQLDSELNQILINRKNVEIAIAENKKQQNENVKAAEAIRVLISNGQNGFEPVVEDLDAALEVLKQQEVTLVDQANTLAANATAKRDAILEVAELVR